MVVGDGITLFVHAKAAVSVAIESPTNIQTVLYHELLQALDMRRASVVVDVQAIC